MRRVLTLGLDGWLADEQPGGVATVLLATATVLLPYIGHHHPILNQLLCPPTPFQPPLPPHRLCCAMAGCPRATYAPPCCCCCCRCRWACVLALLLLCQRRSDLGTSQITRATYSLGGGVVFSQNPVSSKLGMGWMGWMMMMMDGNGGVEEGRAEGREGRVRKPISMILHALRLRAVVSGLTTL